MVGAGIGGGTFGRALAENGMSVLFLERGPVGYRTEQQRIDGGLRDSFARKSRGFWPEPIQATVAEQKLELLGNLGSAVGGTSVFYAASLERPEVHDIDFTPERPHPTGGWPVSYAEFEPYFVKAEEWFHVCGTPDPLSTSKNRAHLVTPPAMSPGDAALSSELEKAGLHPYRAHLGVRYLPNCLDCVGHKCPLPCKMDGRSAGVEPALKTGRATILPNCHVLRLRGNRQVVQFADVELGGEVFAVKGKRFAIACGAIGTPALLLRSRDENWPEGCGNSSGLVGRHLMFHLNELIALWPRTHRNYTGPRKATCLRDLYYVNGSRYGLVQSLGVTADYGNIVHFLTERFDRSFLKGLRSLRGALRIPAAVAANFLGDARIFVGLIEDLPYESNRVELDRVNGFCPELRYHFADELLDRRKAFRSLLRRSLSGVRHMLMTHAPEPNFSHACGTARFGADERTSVLDPGCKAHDLSNLYVVDSSFMPTSTGVNPSLCIAANALRVADTLAARTK